MVIYENGGHAYHATVPTDAIAGFAAVMRETEAYGFDKVKSEQQELGDAVRALLASKGIKSVAAEGFGAESYGGLSEATPSSAESCRPPLRVAPSLT